MTVFPNLSEEEIPPCKICGKVWKRKETNGWVYHVSAGVVCRHHSGVKDWYAQLLYQSKIRGTEFLYN